MRSPAAYMVLGALLLACSSSAKPTASEDATQQPPPAANDPTNVAAAVSGTRLRAKWYVAGDVKQFAGWHDNARNEDCSFATATDGVLRCLPAAEQIVARNAFADPQCTKPAVGVTATGPCDVAYVYQDVYQNNGPNCGRQQVPGRQIQSATKADIVYTNVQGGCQPLTKQPAITYYATGETLAPVSFVDATTSTDSGDGLVAKYLNASDGAREHVGWAIGTLGSDCTFQVMKDTSTRCVPAVPDQSGYELYTDSGCTESTLVQLESGYYGPNCNPFVPSKTWVRRDATQGICEPPTDVVTIGSKYQGSGSLYQKYENTPTSTTCSLRSTGTVSDVYTLGAPLTATLPQTARVISAGGRLVPALVAAIEGPNGPTRDLVRGWHDTDRNVDCAFATATDGKIRCLPVSSTAQLFFDDASCQGNHLVGFGGPTCGADARYGLETSTTCPVVTRVYSLGTPEDVPLGSSSTNGHCVQVPLKNVYPATEADPAQFVEATLSTD